MKTRSWSPAPFFDGIKSIQSYLLDTGLRAELENAITLTIRHYRELEERMRTAVTKGSSEILTAESALDMATEYKRRVTVLTDLLHNIRRSEVRIEPR